MESYTLNSQSLIWNICFQLVGIFPSSKKVSVAVTSKTAPVLQQKNEMKMNVESGTSENLKENVI